MFFVSCTIISRSFVYTKEATDKMQIQLHSKTGTFEKFSTLKYLRKQIKCFKKPVECYAVE